MPRKKRTCLICKRTVAEARMVEVDYYGQARWVCKCHPMVADALRKQEGAPND